MAMVTDATRESRIDAGTAESLPALGDERIEISIEGSAAITLQALSKQAGHDPDQIVSDALGLYEWVVETQGRGLSIASVDQGKVVDEIVTADQVKRGALSRIKTFITGGFGVLKGQV